MELICLAACTTHLNTTKVVVSYPLFNWWVHATPTEHLAAFVSVYGHETPTHLYNSVDHSLQTQQKHEIWLQKIRKVVSERITNEEERVPSFTSLWRHWLRSRWVSQMWQNSPCRDLYSSIPLPEHSGWRHHSDGTYAIEWEALPEIQEKIKDTIDF